jgi:hypothetical protein
MGWRFGLQTDIFPARRVGVLIVAAAVLFISTPGCSLIAGKAASAGLSSVTDVSVSPDPIAMSIGQQQLFKAKAKQTLGNSKDTNADWSVTGGIGFIDSNGLFRATNPGTGQIRATVSTLAGAGKVVGKATVYVSPPAATAPSIASATADPSTAGANSLLTLRATVTSPQGLSNVKSVTAEDLTTGYKVQLVDDGLHYGDATAQDGVYTGQFTIPPGTTVDHLHFGFHAEDYGNPPNSSPWSWSDVRIGAP